MLEVCLSRNQWEPPAIDVGQIKSQSRVHINAKNGDSFLYIFRATPYIDALYVEYDSEFNPRISKRFTFYEGYMWAYQDEMFFHRKCVTGTGCSCDTDMLDEIYVYYNKLYPQWHLKRYISNRFKLLDHIYNCMKKNTAKELLYKAGLDELAVNIYEIDELDLLSTKPSDIFGGLSMNILKSMNCKYGIDILKDEEGRRFVRDINARYPDVFKKKLNEAQCLYMKFLMENNLTPVEVGRLFEAHKGSYERIWGLSQIKDDLIEKSRAMYVEKRIKERIQELNDKIGVIDPIYKDYIKKVYSTKEMVVEDTINQLEKYLGIKRSDYDKMMRRANRKKNQDWQERKHGYVVRYPQTINDFWREAVYMQNCLSGYVPAVLEGDTTIMFIRRVEDVNKPFITVQIQDEVLTQAYHRFNKECSHEEKEWIKAYCRRHDITCGL